MSLLEDYIAKRVKQLIFHKRTIQSKLLGSKHINRTMNNTSWSPAVCELIGVPSNGEDVEKEPLVLKDGTVSWKHFSGLDSLKSAAIESHQLIMMLPSAVQQRIINDCILGREDTVDVHVLFLRGNPHLSLLRCTSFMDLAVGECGFLLSPPGSIISRKIRIILATPQVIDLIGLEASSALVLLVGGLETVNLRNLSWHGFLLPEELWPAWISLLFILLSNLPSVRDLLLAKSALRRPLDDDYVEKVASHDDLSSSSYSLQQLDLAQTLVSHAAPIILNSKFPCQGHQPFWMEAMEWRQRGDCANCLSILFPQIEHSLRVV